MDILPSSLFLCVALKKWEWPRDKAKKYLDPINKIL